MDYVFWFNVFEAGLWTVIGVFCLIQSARRPERRVSLLLMSLFFFLFAGSEIIETQTGAWWKPWWLAVWKGACIIPLVLTGISQYRWQRQHRHDEYNSTL